MKYALTLIAGYYLPSVAAHISLDVCLGIVAGILFGMLVAMLFVGPTPAQKQPAKVTKVRKSRPQHKSIIAKATDYQLFPVSVANMPAIAY